jgi:hypothetical protein
MHGNEYVLHRTGDRAAFMSDAYRITLGRRIERLSAKTSMLGHCCGAVLFPTCDLNGVNYKPFFLYFDLCSFYRFYSEGNMERSLILCFNIFPDLALRK